MNFEFATADRILFGVGVVRQVPARAAGMGDKALVVVGRSLERAQFLLEALVAEGVACRAFSVPDEPTLATAAEGVESARGHRAEVVISLGGGSVIDAGKAVAALLTNGGEPLDYLEGIGRGRPITKRAAPHIAIPTTAGTGAEVTRNAVLGSPKHGVKVSMRSPWMLPTFAVVDPELTYSLPPAITASTGLDALTQLMEAYVSNAANPLTDGICREGLTRAARSLRLAFGDGHNAAAREDMALASLFGGIALANAKLGAVHGFAGPVGGLFPAPHGAVCARLLPIVMEANVKALREHDPACDALARYDTVSRLLTGDAKASADDGIRWVQDLSRELGISALATYGVTSRDVDLIVEKAERASSMKGNPIDLTKDELTRILEQAVQMDLPLGNPSRKPLP